MKTLLIIVGVALFAYGLYLPGIFPGIYFTGVGGALLGIALA